MKPTAEEIDAFRSLLADLPRQGTEKLKRDEDGRQLALSPTSVQQSFAKLPLSSQTVVTAKPKAFPASSFSLPVTPSVPPKMTPLCNCRTAGRDENGLLISMHECTEPAAYTNPRYPDGFFCAKHKQDFEWATKEPWVSVNVT